MTQKRVWETREIENHMHLVENDWDGKEFVTDDIVHAKWLVGLLNSIEKFMGDGS